MSTFGRPNDVVYSRAEIKAIERSARNAALEEARAVIKHEHAIWKTRLLSAPCFDDVDDVLDDLDAAIRSLKQE